MLMELFFVFVLQQPVEVSKDGHDWNELGVQALAERDFEQGILYFQEAKKLLPQDSTVSLNLSRAFSFRGMDHFDHDRLGFAQDDFSTALVEHPDGGRPRSFRARVWLRFGKRQEVEEEARLVRAAFPEHSDGWLLGAQVLVLRGEFSDAVKLLEQGAKVAQPSEAVRERLKAVRKERDFYARYQRTRTPHFQVFFAPDSPAVVDGIPDLVEELESSYVEISTRFGMFPSDALTVLVLPQENYVQDAPEWSAAVYDGRIRIGFSRDLWADRVSRARLARTLRHEYAHAVLHNLGVFLPAWFQEGIAQMAEVESGEHDSSTAGSQDLLALQEGQGATSLGALGGDWTQWEDRDRVQSAYAYSLAFCRWLEKEYGSSVWALLFDAMRGTGFEMGLQKVLGHDSKALDELFRVSRS